MSHREEPQEPAATRQEGPRIQSAYCLPDWEDMDLDPTEEPTSVHSSPAPTNNPDPTNHPAPNDQPAPTHQPAPTILPAAVAHSITSRPVYSVIHSSPVNPQP